MSQMGPIVHYVRLKLYGPWSKVVHYYVNRGMQAQSPGCQSSSFWMTQHSTPLQSWHSEFRGSLWSDHTHTEKRARLLTHTSVSTCTHIHPFEGKSTVYQCSWHKSTSNREPMYHCRRSVDYSANCSENIPLYLYQCWIGLCLLKLRLHSNIKPQQW